MIRPPVNVDAFVGEGARGNPAAVMLCGEFPGEAEMQAMAREIGAPASAFVGEVAIGGAHPVRWFAPDREIALCGHGALAAGHVLLARSDADRVRLRTHKGDELDVQRLDGAAHYELALPAILTAPRGWSELAAALGAQPLEIRWNAAGYALAVLNDAAEVRALAPDLSGLESIQLSVTAPGDMGADVTSRVFSGGIEDAATGSAHAVLTPYWCARLGRGDFSAWQASERGGRFECRLDGERVWLGGQCAPAGLT